MGGSCDPPISKTMCRAASEGTLGSRPTASIYKAMLNGIVNQLRIALHLHFLEDAGAIGVDRADAE